MEKFVRKIAKDGQSNEFYIVESEWIEHDVTLIVIDEDTAWAGKIDPIQLANFCSATHKTEDEYLTELKHAFTESKNEFTFVRDKCNYFIVKKVDFNSKIKIKFCSVLLKEISPIPIYNSLLSRLIDQEKGNKNTIEQLSLKIKDLNDQQQHSMEKLEKFAHEKASLETILYSKFCEILNAKKDRITYLETLIGAGGDSTLLTAETFIKADNSEFTNSAGKRTHLEYPESKRKCTDKKTVECESQSTFSKNIVSSTTAIEICDKNVNHYDSETDIDTDDESINNLTAITCVKTVPASVDPEETRRILPERNTSKNVLPKRECNADNVKSMNSKTLNEPLEERSSLSKKESEEFNSQSLLDAF